MVRKLAAALLGVGVLVPGLVQALGLGGIKLNSALSEPLDAEIELVQVRELTSDEIKPNLASNADFDAHNVEKFHFLTEMKFDVVVNQTGRSFIKVTSRKPMKEPFINFLVEVHWPEGRLLREYTMLLDPPVYRAQVAPNIRRSVVAAPKTQPRPVAASTPRPAPSSMGGAPASSAPSPRSAPTSSAPASAAPAADGTYGPTGPSDNLWAIAEQMRPSNRVNVHQTMLAIQQLNPQAFLNGNINLLKRGQVLRGPSEEDAAAISSQEAIRMVAEQNRAWREKTTTPQTAQAAPVDTTGKGAGTVPSRVENEDGKLTLVAPAKTESVSAETGQGGEAATSGGVLRDKLALAEETTDKFKLENEDLKLKLADLQDQTATTSQVLKLKDDQIAALQAKMAELQAQLEQVKQGSGTAPASTAPAVTPVESAVDTATTAPTEVAPAATPATPDAPVAEKEPPMAVEPPPETPPADVDYNYDATKTPPAEKTPEVESVGGGVVSDIQKPQLVTPEAPKPVETPVAEPSLAQEILNNWFYLLGIAGLGAVGLAGYSLSRRKKETTGEFDDAMVKDFALPKQTPAPLEDVTEPTVVPSAIAAAIPETKKDETVAQTADVVGEADIYIAYGRFNQAVELLEKALAKEPQRDDVRLKLLEVAVESKNPELFDQHAAVISQRGDANSVSKVDALRARLPSVMAPAATMVGSATSPEVSDELDESLQDLDFDTGSLDFSKPAQTPVSTEPVGGLDFNLDFSLSDTPVPAKAEVAKPMPPAMQDNALDFDLEMDLEKEFEGTATNAKPAPPSLMAEVVEDDEVPALEFDGDITLEAPALASAGDMDADIDEGIELELADDESPVAELDVDAPLEFELVEDLESTSHPDTLLAEDDVRHAMDFEKEETIDSSSAAMLADELDFEEPSIEVAESTGGFDLDETIEAPAPVRQVMSFDETIEAPAPVRQPPAATSFKPAPMGKMDGGEEDLDFITDGDESSTKLDLARAYIDMGDREGAKDILDEVLLEGNADQQREAKELLARLE